MSDTIQKASDVAGRGRVKNSHGVLRMECEDGFLFDPPDANALRSGFLALKAELEAVRAVCDMRKVTDFYLSDTEASCQRHELSIGGLKHYAAPTAVELKAKLEASDGQ